MSFKDREKEAAAKVLNEIAEKVFKELDSKMNGTL